MEFPYRTDMISDQEKIAIFDQLKTKRLRKYVTTKLLYKTSTKLAKVFYLKDGRFQHLINDVPYELTMLSDYFVDHCRVQCRFGKHVSPQQYWDTNKDSLIEQVKAKGLEVNRYNLREAVYENTVECSIHNPMIIKYFIDTYKAKSVLDMSSGWGDRLIGSLLCDVEHYVGTDPNSCLYAAYDNIIKTFRPLTKNKGSYHVNHAKFEEVDLKGQKFDLMYSSPPYFDYEIYTDKEGDHSLGDFGEDEWLQLFMYPSVLKIEQALKEGGKAVFYFSQAKGRTYIEKWFDWMQTLPNMYYLGNMFYSDVTLRKHHPIFIYEKRSKVPRSLYDPPIAIRKISGYNIIEEDRLLGGTKSRAILPFLEDVLKANSIKTIMYAGASNGYAQVALAQSLRLLKSNIKLVIYLQKTGLPDVKAITNLAKSIYHIEYRVREASLWEVMAEAQANVNESTYLVPFGLDDDKFRQLLKKSLGQHLKSAKIPRLWLTAGSGTILSILYDILPKTEFHVVQVGKAVDVSKYDRVTLYVSSYKLYQAYPGKIPYPTTKSYDGKVWEFSQHFKPGDYIWNTAGIHSLVSH